MRSCRGQYLADLLIILKLMSIRKSVSFSKSLATIDVENLSKHYGGRPILDKLTFNVRAGEVYALVGPNGAGKTTAIRLVAGLAFPTSGSVRLMGQDPILKPKVKLHLGAVVEAPAAFYPYLSGRDNLNLHAKLVGKVNRKRINEVLEIMELSNAAERKVGVYSLGMRQRLGVAAAILTKPNILILDEPASGMDPLSLHLVHRVLQESAENGAAVLLSTHHLDEVVTYCTKVGILEEGKLIDEVLLAKLRGRYRIKVDQIATTIVALESQPFVATVEARADNVVFSLSDKSKLGELTKVLSDEGVQILELKSDIFDLKNYYADKVTDYADVSNSQKLGRL